MPQTRPSGGLSSGGEAGLLRMGSARSSDRGMNVAYLEALPPGPLLILILSRKSWGLLCLD